MWECVEFAIAGSQDKSLQISVNESNEDIVDTDTEKTAPDSDPDFQERSKQEKYQFNSSMLDGQSDDMPFRFHHIQGGL